jgi:hypothetical protein
MQTAWFLIVVVLAAPGSVWHPPGSMPNIASSTNHFATQQECLDHGRTDEYPKAEGNLPAGFFCVEGYLR